MPPNFEMVSFVIQTVVGCVLMFLHAKHPRSTFATAIIIPAVYSWVYVEKIHRPLTSKMEHMYRHRLVRRNPQLRSLCREIIECRVWWHIMSDKCSLCAVLQSRMFIYLGCQPFENGRRFRISRSPDRFSYVISINCCLECYQYDCHDILLKMLKNIVTKRQRLVKRANLVKSLMVQRYLRRRLPEKHLTETIMSFVFWTPEISIS